MVYHYAALGRIPPEPGKKQTAEEVGASPPIPTYPQPLAARGFHCEWHLERSVNFPALKNPCDLVPWHPQIIRIISEIIIVRSASLFARQPPAVKAMFSRVLQCALRIFARPY